MFDIPETAEVATMWFCAHESGDFMAIVWRDTPQAGWRSMMRFRHYVDDKIFGSDDEKKWYGCAEQQPTEECKQMLVRLMDEALAKAKEALPWFKMHVDFRADINGTHADFFAMLMKQPWAHAQVQHQPGTTEIRH